MNGGYLNSVEKKEKPTKEKKRSRKPKKINVVLRRNQRVEKIDVKKYKNMYIRLLYTCLFPIVSLDAE